MARIELFNTGSNQAHLDHQVILHSSEMPENGWITEIGIRAEAINFYSGEFTYRLVIYDDSERIFTSAGQSWGTTLAMRVGTPSPAVKVSNGTTLWWGVWSGNRDGVNIDGDTNQNKVVKYRRRTDLSLAPELLPTTFDGTMQDRGMRGYLEYVVNNAPPKPTFFSDSPTGVVTTSQPEIHVALPKGADAAYDSIELMRVRTFFMDDPSNIWQNSLYNITNAEDSSGEARRTLASLPAGSNVGVEFQIQDSWGVWSDWSNTRTFTVSAGPDKPTVTRPTGKVNYRNQAEYQAQGGSGNLYAGSYNNPNGQAMHSVWVEVYNRERTTRLKSSGWVSRTASAGVWTLGEWSGHGLYDYGQKLSIRAKVREVATGGVDPGIESPFGPWTDVTVNSRPTKPVNLTPSEGVAVGTLDFSASVADPDNDAITAAVMRVTSLETNQLLAIHSNRGNNTAYTSGQVRRPGSPNGYRYRANNSGKTTDAGATFPTTVGATVKEIPSVLIARSTAYALNNTRLRPAGSTADALFFECTTAGTTAASAPTAYNTAVEGGTVTDGTAVFTARAAITWQNLGVDTERDMVVTGDTIDLTFTGFLTLGKEYSWQAKASDAVAYGDWSDPAVFRYVLVPGVTVLAPLPSQRRNWIEDPSFEDPTATFWTREGTNATNTIDVIAGNAAAGDNFLRFVLDGTTQSASSRIITPTKAVDATKTWLIQAEMREKLGSGRFTLSVICKNASGTVVGTLNPSLIVQALNTDPADDAWHRYGGVIWPIGSSNTPAFPTGTTQVQIAIYGQATAVAGGVTADVDAVAFEQITTVTDNAMASYAVMWSRFFTGASDFSNTEVSPYSWLGEEHNSESQGIPVLSSVGARIYYRYTSGGALNQNAKQLEIERLINGEFKKVYDSGMVLSTVTPNSIDFLTLPLGVLSSQHRYRLIVTVRDTALVNASTTPIEFDVFYYGPAEIIFTDASLDQERGSILLQYEPTTLGEDFDGYQLARRGPGEPFAVFATNTDPADTGGEYPFPVNGKTYRFFVRQRQRVSGERVESRWTEIPIEALFPEIFYLKDPLDPSLVLPIDVRQQEAPTMESVPSSFGSYRPFEESGRVHWGAYSADSSESYVFNVWDDDPEKLNKVQIAEDFRTKPRTLMLMAQRPDEKLAVYPRRISRTRGATPLYASYTIEFEESTFDEDMTTKVGAEG